MRCVLCGAVRLTDHINCSPEALLMGMNLLNRVHQQQVEPVAMDALTIHRLLLTWSVLDWTLCLSVGCFVWAVCAWRYGYVTAACAVSWSPPSSMMTTVTTMPPGPVWEAVSSPTPCCVFAHRWLTAGGGRAVDCCFSLVPMDGSLGPFRRCSVSCREMNNLEREFMRLVDYQVFVSAESYIQVWRPCQALSVLSSCFGPRCW